VDEAEWAFVSLALLFLSLHKVCGFKSIGLDVRTLGIVSGLLLLGL